MQYVQPSGISVFLAKPSNRLAIHPLPLLLQFVFISSYDTGISVNAATIAISEQGLSLLFSSWVVSDSLQPRGLQRGGPLVFLCVNSEGFTQPQKYEAEGLLWPLYDLEVFHHFFQALGCLHDAFLHLMYKHRCFPAVAAGIQNHFLGRRFSISFFYTPASPGCHNKVRASI